MNLTLGAYRRTGAPRAIYITFDGIDSSHYRSSFTDVLDSGFVRIQRTLGFGAYGPTNPIENERRLFTSYIFN